MTSGSDCVTLSKSLQPLDLWHLSGDYSSGLRGKGTRPGMCSIKPRAPGGVGPGPSPAGAVVGAAKPIKDVFLAAPIRPGKRVVWRDGD